MSTSERQRRYLDKLRGAPAPATNDGEVARLKARNAELEAALAHERERNAKLEATQATGGVLSAAAAKALQNENSKLKSQLEDAKFGWHRAEIGYRRAAAY